MTLHIQTSIQMCKVCKLSNSLAGSFSRSLVPVGHDAMIDTVKAIVYECGADSEVTRYRNLHILIAAV